MNTSKLESKEVRDSIFTSYTKDSVEVKYIYHPSKRRDSFNYRKEYVNGKLESQGYITENGFRIGLWNDFSNENKFTGEFMNINGEETLNQYWYTKGKDTVGGMHYRLKFFDSLKVNKHFHVEVLLSHPKYDSSKVFFVKAKGNMTNLKEDFSNINEIELDTIYNIAHHGIPSKPFYEGNWDDLAIQFKKGYSKIGKKYLRGVLVEQSKWFYSKKFKDTLQGINNIYINKELYISN